MKIKYNDFLRILEKSNYIISLSELEKIIKNVFGDKKVSSVDTVYEKIDNGNKFILTINNLFYEKTNIIHTKFVFYTDDDKRKLSTNYFHYLYDINCNFKKVEFDSIDNLELNLNNILDNREFGDNLKDLSDISINIVTKVNEWLKKDGVDTISLYNINYNPVTDNIPCDSLFFQFDINVDDTRFIKMNIKKLDKNEYKLTFSENDWFENVTIDSLRAIPQTIGYVVKNHII